MAEDAEPAALLRQAWEQCYLAPLAAGELGQRLADAETPLSGYGWLHVALAEVRVGDSAVAEHALRQARSRLADPADARGLAWCDEVQAIALRRAGHTAASARLQAEIDRREDFERDAMYRFVAHNSRAMTRKHLGDSDAALRHFYAASDAAARTGWAGPRIAALNNLGGYHQDLYNLDDARRLSTQALEEARAAHAGAAMATAAANLIVAHHAGGEPALARAMVQLLLDLAPTLPRAALARYSAPLALGHLAVGEVAAALRLLDTAPAASHGDGSGQAMQAWIHGRCLLELGQAAQARHLAEAALQQRREDQRVDQPYDLMELHRVLADACEQTGDHRAALACMRQAHALYEQLVGRSARARFIALEVGHRLATAQRERDRAVNSALSIEDDRHRLAELNAALQTQIAQTELLHAQLREQALNDPLTGLHNRRYLFEVAPGLLDLARRQARSLCVVLIDLDHFKLLNDTFGHQAGDRVLRRFATLMREMLRRSDVVCRHGGEEFVAVLPDIDGDGAQTLLTRLLQAFQSLPPEPGQRRTPNASFSAGIALFPRHGVNLEQLLSRADRALYAAKNGGRARIEQVPFTAFGTLA